MKDVEGVEVRLGSLQELSKYLVTRQILWLSGYAELLFAVVFSSIWHVSFICTEHQVRHYCKKRETVENNILLLLIEC